MGEHQREVPFEPTQDRQHRSDEVTSSRPGMVGAGHQVDGHFGVGVAGELDPGGLQFTAQDGEVLDNAVVHYGELPGGIAVRMGVAVGGRPWVAQRVWPTPEVPLRAAASVSARAASRLARRPARRRTVSPPLPSSTAIPDES